MSQRKVLVIGSQCTERPALDFLPSLATDLYDVLTDSKIGMCTSALDEQKGLLIDCETIDTKKAIKSAFEKASVKGDTLLIALVGHGISLGNDFYYMAKDSPGQVDSDNAIDLAQLIKENYRKHSYIDGLIVLVDTCYSGVAATKAACAWAQELDIDTRFEILTATGQDPAYDGCFTHVLVNTLRRGIPEESSEALLCLHLSKVINQDNSCGGKQETDHMGRKYDTGLFLGRNVALATREQPWRRTSIWSEIERHTQWFQATPQLSEIVKSVKIHRCVALVGNAGSGKSSLMASLARTEVTQKMVPDGFLHAIIFLSEARDSNAFATSLSDQLQSSVRGFSNALKAYEERIPLEEWKKMEILQRSIVEPLYQIPATQIVRIGVDALDQLPESDVLGVYRSINRLLEDPSLSHVKFIVSGRPDTTFPVGSERQDIDKASYSEIMTYLADRDISLQHRERIVQKSEGSWLVARLLADLSAEKGLESEELPNDLVGIYDRILQNIGATLGNDRWRKELRPLLSILAVSGSGPVLPIELLCDSSQRLGGASKISAIRDSIVDLTGFINRQHPGTMEEHNGLFHTTFAEYLKDSEKGIFSIEISEAKDALIESISFHAPMEDHDEDNDLHHYAATIEAQLLWSMGRYEKAMESNEKRQSVVQIDNLRRWENWYEFIREQLPLDSLYLLTTRFFIAFFTGLNGNTRDSIKLFQELLLDQVRILGKDHSIVFSTRGNIAAYMSMNGNWQAALEEFKNLLVDKKRVLGEKHHETLVTRGNIIGITGRHVNRTYALELLENLLLDEKRILGEDDRDTLTTRMNIAVHIGEDGDYLKALEMLNQLLLDQERFLGKEDLCTFCTRRNIASFTKKAGDLEKSLDFFKKLLVDQGKNMVPEHPDMFKIRENIALLEVHVENGNKLSALELLKSVLADKKRALGPCHPDTLTTRGSIINLMVEAGGDVQEAICMRRELLNDITQIQGSEHLDTLTTRHLLAQDVGTSGNYEEAIALLRLLLADQKNILGDQHPDLLRTRRYIAIYTAQNNDKEIALALFEQLLPDQERLIGSCHKDTLATREYIAGYRVDKSEFSIALPMLELLLNDQRETLGYNHPNTFITCENIAKCMAENGDLTGAISLLKLLIHEQQVTFGRGHSSGFITRSLLATYMVKNRNLAESVEILESLVKDQISNPEEDCIDIDLMRKLINYVRGLLPKKSVKGFGKSEKRKSKSSKNK